MPMRPRPCGTALWHESHCCLSASPRAFLRNSGGGAASVSLPLTPLAESALATEVARVYLGHWPGMVLSDKIPGP